ncbi:MAG: alpha/beta hydrolase [Candidatus Omnitrophota bacterium]
MIKGIIFIAIFLGVGFLYIKYLEKKSVFFPAKEIEFTPAAIGLSFEDVYLNTADNIQINGWFISQEEAKYTILFLHGNGGNIGDRLEKIKMFYEMGVNMFIIDYRGYGNSKGKPHEKGIYKDAKAAYNYLVGKRGINPVDIVFYGESLGGAAAIVLASQVKAGGLILEGTFSSGRDMAKIMYPFMPSFLFPNLFDSLGKIKSVNAPKLFIHSRDDEVVPFRLGKKLYNAASSPKELIEIEGPHNNVFLDSKEKYISSIKRFIEQVSKKEL